MHLYICFISFHELLYDLYAGLVPRIGTGEAASLSTSTTSKLAVDLGWLLFLFVTDWMNECIFCRRGNTSTCGSAGAACGSRRWPTARHTRGYGSITRGDRFLSFLATAQYGCQGHRLVLYERWKQKDDVGKDGWASFFLEWDDWASSCSICEFEIIQLRSVV